MPRAAARCDNSTKPTEVARSEGAPNPKRCPRALRLLPLTLGVHKGGGGGKLSSELLAEIPHLRLRPEAFPVPLRKCAVGG